MKINGIPCTIDLVQSYTMPGRMVWNETQSEQHQAPQHSTIKFRLTCQDKQLAGLLLIDLIRFTQNIARIHECTFQNSGGMTNAAKAVKFGATFHGKNSALCIEQITQLIEA